MGTSGIPSHLELELQRKKHSGMNLPQQYRSCFDSLMMGQFPRPICPEKLDPSKRIGYSLPIILSLLHERHCRLAMSTFAIRRILVGGLFMWPNEKTSCCEWVRYASGRRLTGKARWKIVLSESLRIRSKHSVQQ